MNPSTLALEQLMRGVGDPVAVVRGIAPTDPAYDRALLIRAAAGVLAKTPEAYGGIAHTIHILEGLSSTAQVRAHVTAAQAWIAGDPVLAAERYAAVLDQWPQDLLALRLAQSCFFYLGWHDRLCSLVDAVLPEWPRERRGYGFVLAIASYAHAENGEPAYAEKLGRQSLAIDPGCPSGVHAVAHAIAESGRPAEGARWMREQMAHWSGESRMRSHNAWHLGTFDAAQGNLDSALGIVDGWLLPAAAHSMLDACDATALLWQISTLGVDPGTRWRRVSDAFESYSWPGFWPYVDLHAAFAHWNARQPARLEALTRAIAKRAGDGDYAALRARYLTLPGLDALRAWTDGRRADAIEAFSWIRPNLGQMGGSRVQLEIFASIEREARRYAQRDPLALRAA